ncbi:hypothetical protein BH11MYX3_BH11MYX3_10980 [soil metagenome]
MRFTRYGSIVAAERITLFPNASNRRIIGYPIITTALVFAFLGGMVGVIIALALVAGYVALYIKLVTARMFVDETGVEHAGAFSSRRLGWDEVTRYQFVSIDPTANVGAAGGGLIGALAVAAVKAMQGKGGNRRFKAGRLTLHGQGKHKLTLTSRFKGVDAALDLAFTQLHHRLAGCTQFGDLSFDGNALRHRKKGELSIAEIASVNVTANGTVTVRKVGKRLAWANLPMARLDNPILLFDRLADRSIQVDMSQEVFLPHPTIALLATAASARANLPKAVVHKR